MGLKPGALVLPKVCKTALPGGGGRGGMGEGQGGQLERPVQGTPAPGTHDWTFGLAQEWDAQSTVHLC